MKRLLLALLIATSATMASGCAMCCGTYDYAYPTYGGKLERADREWGRVGSNLSGAGIPDIGGAGVISDSGTVIEQPYYGDSYGDSSGGVIMEGSEAPIYPVENGTIIYGQ